LREADGRSRRKAVIGPRPWTSKWESGAAPHRQRTGWKAPSVII